MPKGCLRHCRWSQTMADPFHTYKRQRKKEQKKVQIYYLPAAVAVNDRRSAPEGETEKVSGRAM